MALIGRFKQTIQSDGSLENTAVDAVFQAVGSDEGHLYIVCSAYMVDHPL